MLTTQQQQPQTDTNPQAKKVVYFVSMFQQGEVTRRGHVNRAVAIKRALSKACEYYAQQQGEELPPVEVWLAGTNGVGNWQAAGWDDVDRFVDLTPNPNPDGNNVGVGVDISSVITQWLLEFKPDLLIIDCFLDGLIPYLRLRQNNPDLLEQTAVWLAARYLPEGFPSERYIVDRLYYLGDSFHVHPSQRGMFLARESTRSEAERDGTATYVEFKWGGQTYRRVQNPPFTPEDPYGYYVKINKADRKLLPPVVNVFPEDIYSRAKARRKLWEFAGVSEERIQADAATPFHLQQPIVLAAGNIHTRTESGRRALAAFIRWVNEQFADIEAEWSPTRFMRVSAPALTNQPEGEGETKALQTVAQQLADGTRQPFLIAAIGDGRNSGLQGNIARYLPGVDYLLSTAGAASFYDARYVVKDLRLAPQLNETSCVRFFGLPRDYSDDQEWRAKHADTLWSCYIKPTPNLPVGEPLPRGNGAWEFVRLIYRKLWQKDVILPSFFK